MRTLIRAAVLLALNGLAVFAANFTVNCTNGVVNVTGQDTVAVVDCLLPGGGSFTGNVDVTSNDSQVLIRLTGGSFSDTNCVVFCGSSTTPVVDVKYFLLGTGIERAAFDGTLGNAGDVTDGTEFFAEAVYGTSFNPLISATTQWNGPGPLVNLPIPVSSGPNTVEGQFDGSGDALLFVKYQVGGGTAYTFPTSVDGELAAAPEPGTLILGLAFLLPGLLALRRRASLSN